MGRPKGSKNKPKMDRKENNTPENNNLKNNTENSTNSKNKNEFAEVFNLSTSFNISSDDALHEDNYQTNTATEDDLNWVNRIQIHPNNTFLPKQPQFKIPYDNELTYLKYFFNENFINNLYLQTNKTVSTLKVLDPTITLISRNELLVFIGITLYMGIHNLPDLKLYWDKNIIPENTFDFRVPFIQNAMAYKRFVFIRNHFMLTHHSLNEAVYQKVIIKNK